MTFSALCGNKYNISETGIFKKEFSELAGAIVFSRVRNVGGYIPEIKAGGRPVLLSAGNLNSGGFVIKTVTHAEERHGVTHGFDCFSRRSIRSTRQNPQNAGRRQANRHFPSFTLIPISDLRETPGGAKKPTEAPYPLPPEFQLRRFRFEIRSIASKRIALKRKRHAYFGA
jgi:hypothetical protein